MLISSLSERHGRILAAVLPLLMLLVVGLLEPNFSYTTWDNFEFYTPLICEAHTQWLNGEFPHWNPHQQMGEPLHATFSCGALYFPYTLALGLLKCLGLSNAALPLIVVASHAAAASLGWYFLLRRLSVRPVLALLTALSVSQGGYFTAVSAAWLFMAPVFAWTPWLLWSSVNVLSASARRRHVVLLALGLAALAHPGQPQMTVYTWIFAGIFALSYGCFVERQLRCLWRWAAAAAIAVLLSLPSVIPGYYYLAQTTRQKAWDIAAICERSVTWDVLRDILLPIYSYANTFMPNSASVMLHQGAWVGPIIAATLLGLLVRRRRQAAGESTPPDEQILARTFLVALVCTAIFFLFALGRQGLLLPLTHGLPGWSAFRWPFKFLPFVNCGLALAAGIGLELCARRLPCGRRGLVALSVACTALALLLTVKNVDPDGQLNPQPLWQATWSALVLAILGLLTIPVCVWVSRPWARAMLLANVPISALALIALCHFVQMKPYAERYASVGPAELGISTSYRVLPLNVEYPGAALQECGCNQWATANGYYSVSGSHTDDFVPTWYARCLPTDIFGLLPGPVVKQLLGSHLLRSFNVRYVLVLRRDTPKLKWLATHPAYRLLKRLQIVDVYEDRQALPRAYFACALRPFSLQALCARMLANAGSLREAHVEGVEAEESVADATIRDASFGNARVVIEVDAPRGGFLVISQKWAPGWQAQVDGQPAELKRVNGTLCGVRVPPGCQQVSLRYCTPGLLAGAACAAAGLLLLIGWMWILPGKLVHSTPRAGEARATVADK